MSHNIDLTAAALHYSMLYWAVIVICGLFLAFGKIEGKRKRRCIFLVSTIFFILIAFRGENMGNDTDAYIEMFDVIASVEDPFDFIRNSAGEVGFSLYTWFLSRIVDDPRILFVVSAGFIVASIGVFAYKYVDNLGLFYGLFIGTMHFDFFLSGVRNAISIAIFLFAIEFLLKRKALPYSLICIAALLFHNTAIIYFPLYFVFSPRALAKKSGIISSILLIIAAFFSGFFFNYLLEFFFRLFPKYMYYIGGDMLDGKTRVAVVLKIAVCLLLIVVPKLARKTPTLAAARDRMGKRMAMINLLVMFVAAGATAFMRVATLFHLYTLMQYSNEVGRMRSRSADKVWLVALTLIAFYVYGLVLVVMKTPDWQTTYPVQLCWWIN